MPDLVPVHGGLDAPVSRTVPLSRRKQFLAEAAGLPRIEMSRADLATVYRIADGTLSPLEGPMDEETWHPCSTTTRSSFGFRRYAWTAPIAFPVTDAEAKQLRVGHSAALVFDGDIVGALRVSSMFDWDKAKHVERFYGTAPHRSSRRPHDHGRSAHEAGRRRPLGAAAAGRPGVRLVHPRRRARCAR